MADKKKVLVVGAGVGGLTLAYRLQEAGFEVTVLETLPYAGGRARSISKANSIIDLGATVLPGTYRETFQLISELGLSGQLDTVGGNFAVPRQGKMHLISLDHPLRSLLGSPLLSLGSKLKLAKLMVKLLPMLPRFSFTSLAPLAREDRETLAAYCQRELPTEVYDYLLNPMLKFLYIHNGQSGSVVELLWWLNTMGLSPSRSFRNGMATLTDALAQRLDVKLNTTVENIARTTSGVAVVCHTEAGEETWSADYCVVSTPAPVTAEIAAESLDARQLGFMNEREYAPCIVVSHCTKKRPALDVVMVEVPDEVSEDLATLVFQHNIATGRAPAGKGIVNAYFTEKWSREWLEADDATILQEVKKIVEPLVPEIDDLVDYHIQRWPYNAALSEIGACRRIGDFQAGLNDDDRVLYIGDYLVQASINVAVATANKAAQSIIRRSSAVR